LRKINQAGLELVKSFEGLRLNAYQDSVGVWTIGYGSTKGVKRGQRITEEEAEELLREDLSTAEAGVEAALAEDVTDNQFAACVSLAFNVGVGAFRKSSIVKFINSGDPLLAADRFLLYDRAGGKKLAGLTRRRKAERKLFLTDDEPILNGEATEPAPMAVLTETKTTVETAEGKTEEKTSFASSVVSSEKAKEIAGTGLSTIGNKLATGGISTGVLSAVGAFLEKAWPLLIFAAVLIILGFMTWWLIYNAKQKQKLVEGQIAADPARKDITFGVDKAKPKTNEPTVQIDARSQE
jgi:GH24 family phage-related lysozyme (muramidase)